MNASAVPVAKKGKGCLPGCLIAGGIVLVGVVAVSVFLYTQGGRIGRGLVDRLTGGGIDVEAPAEFRQVPLPLALAAPGARSSVFTGEKGLAETREAFIHSLQTKGWTAMDEEDGLAEAFSFLIQDGDDGGMTVDFFRKGDEVLMLYVVGAGDVALAKMVALPEDSEIIQRSREHQRRPRDAAAPDRPRRDLPGEDSPGREDPER